MARARRLFSLTSRQPKGNSLSVSTDPSFKRSVSIDRARLARILCEPGLSSWRSAPQLYCHLSRLRCWFFFNRPQQARHCSQSMHSVLWRRGLWSLLVWSFSVVTWHLQASFGSVNKKKKIHANSVWKVVTLWSFSALHKNIQWLTCKTQTHPLKWRMPNQDFRDLDVCNRSNHRGTVIFHFCAWLQNDAEHY